MRLVELFSAVKKTMCKYIYGQIIRILANWYIIKYLHEIFDISVHQS